MITAGEPQEFIPLGREHLRVHPGDVYLPVENTPATPAPKATDFSRDLLRALRGVSLKEQKEDWFLKASGCDGEEEFYYNGKTVVWSKSNGHGIRTVLKSFTMENPVQQVLWAEFNIRSCKPRTIETIVEIEDLHKEVLSGLCILENSSLSVFSEFGEDFIVSIPFQVMKAWPSKYGMLFERNIVSDENPNASISNVSNHLPLIFNMMHPLDDISPVIKRTCVSNSMPQISYFTDPGEVIVFSCVDPSLVMTYNKKGYHTVWRARVTTFPEAEFACNNILKETASEIESNTPLRHSSVPSKNQSRIATHHNTPISSNSPSFWSHPPSRIASPIGGYQSYTMSPSVSSLNHMAALSRSHSPSMNNSISLRQNYTPLSLSAMSHRSALSPVQNNRVYEFMDPLAPDVCLDHEWTEQSNLKHPEGAYKAFLSKDITGHNFLCYLLKERRRLKLVKFEETNDTSQWIFGTTSCVPALDAETLPELNLIIVVDLNNTLSLYTGLTKVSKVHVANIFGPFSEISCPSGLIPPSSFDTPIRNSFISSTRPPSALSTRFGDESQVLSPVSLNADESPPKPVLINEEVSCLHVGPVKGLRDPIRDRVTLETNVGDFRLQMPQVAVSEIVDKCLKALKYILPRDIYTHVFVKWYSKRNAPGPSDMTCESELNAFLLCVLSIAGFDTENLTLGNYFKYEPSLAPAVVKKQKTHENGCDDDWNYLLAAKENSTFRKSSFMDTVQSETKHQTPSYSDTATVNTSAILFPYIANILYGIHLIYEDSKLKVSLWDCLPQLCSFLCELSRELRQSLFIDHYWKDFPEQFHRCYKKCLLTPDQISNIHFPPNYFKTSPSMYEWIHSSLTTGKWTSFPYIPHVTTSLRNVILVYAVLSTDQTVVQQVDTLLTRVVAPGHRVQDASELTILSCYNVSTNPKKAAVLLITQLGITINDIDTWPVGIALAVKDAILHCWHAPSGLWSKDVFDLIGRCDLSALQSKRKRSIAQQQKQECNKNGMAKDNEDGINYLDLEVLRLRFSQDHRVHDVFHMLQSSKPVRIALQQRPEVSDHEFIEEQERHLYNLCIRTMAATVGRGMFTLRTYNPVVTETLPIPKLCLTGRAPPRNTTVDLSHIDVPANMNMWPLFHNGVAAGLRISSNASKIDSTWMVYNKPRSSSNDTPTEHAGFLMALGLNGHLSNLTTLSIHDYLCKGHELTSVGILLGVSAAKRGTMDLSATKMLSIHVEALLPPTSTELDVPPAVQVAAVMGLGLLYQGSAHHHMAEVLLGEIGRPPGPEMEHCVDRESYSLAAGLALGLVTLGKGKEMSGIADLPMADQLYHYMVGGHKRPLTGVHKEKHKSPSYQIREGDNVNVDVTSPGATLALGMMFFNTDNQAIAEWMTAPDTQFLLDMVRPDFLLLRTLSKGLILWSSIHPSVKWVESHLPDIVAKHAFKRGITNADVDYETMSQAYCNIIAGGCFSVGLKFAGSANSEAFETLMQYAKHFLSLSRKLLGDQAGRSTIETCLNVVVLSLAMVMAGTGDLDVIRICRHLRSRISQASSYVLYGSHMVTHMALGLLFLGGGSYSLSTSPLAIGALVCAFFPKFPQHSNDNRYHLQAFYHLYVLAVEPRIIVPRLIDSDRPVYINITVEFKDTLCYKNVKYSVKAPCLLPELKFLKQVRIEDARYWPIVFHCEENWSVLRKTLENCGNLFVMQNAGCLPYSEDPRGFRSLLAQSYIWNNIHAWNIKNVQISNFSSDPVALNFATCFLQRSSQAEQEKEWQQKTCGFLFECASLEKMEALPICISMIQIAKSMNCNYQTFDLWQVKMLAAYEKWNKKYRAKHKDPLALLRPNFSLAVTNEVGKILKQNVKDLKECLLHYITQNLISATGIVSDYPTALPAFLLFFNVPHLGPLALQIMKGDLNIPSLYGQLREKKLSTSSVMSILSILRS